LGVFILNMNFKKIRISEHRNAIINVDLVVGIFYEHKSLQFTHAGFETVIRFSNGYWIVIPDNLVEDLLVKLDLKNV
jgi:hypothetical protein